MPIWSAEIKELETLHTSIKGRFPELEKELERLIKADDENMVLLYSRRCLEVIITDLCESELKRPRKTEPLKGIIDKLNREEKVPSNIIASMQSLNSLSTFGAHPKEFDPEQVKPVLNNLATIIKWYLKYKYTRAISKPGAEEETPETKPSEYLTEHFQKPKKRLILLLSGFALVIVIVIIIVFNVFTDKERAEVNTELEKSIAVLPFENLSSDEEQAWFSEGTTDIIINQLSKISDFRVVGRTSTLKYKEEKKSIPEIGEELGVNYVIEGTVQRQENEMRISVQLVRVINEDHIWSDVYDKEWKDIFDVQSDIAQAIAEELKTILTTEEKEEIEKSKTNNPEAYNLYLQGRFFWYMRTEEGLQRSVEYFKKAIDIDTNYALAYAGLADAYFIQAYWGWIPWAEGTDTAKETVLKALAIDENLSEAHTVLGALLNYKEWKWEEARKELQIAVDLNPKFVTAHHYYSELLSILRENEEARKQINIALEIEPFLPVLHVLSSAYYYREGKLKEALDECHLVEELDPEYSNRTIYRSEFNIYLKLQEELKALAALQKAFYTDTLDSESPNIVLDTYNNSGISGIWRLLIESETKKPAPNARSLANIYAKIDNKENALTCLEKAFENPPPGFPFINNNPDLDNLRFEPRFQAIIEKMGLLGYMKKE